MADPEKLVTFRYRGKCRVTSDVDFNFALLLVGFIWPGRRDMVDGESKANLRSAVAEALLEYRRTCAAEDIDAFQVCRMTTVAGPR